MYKCKKEEVKEGGYLIPVIRFNKKLEKIKEIVLYSVEKEIKFLFKKEKINTDIYDLGIFSEYQRGHWDIYSNEIETKEISKKEMIKIKIDEAIYSRNPKKDIKFEGIASIDFGTKSTVVAFQEENDRSKLMKIGGISYKKEEKSQYENPTVMEFLDIKNFLKDYESFKGRPFTKWRDLKISHSAVSDFIGGSTSVVEGLKQWCGNEREKLIIFDSKGEEIYLPPYLELKEGDLDPIEIYAYYIGSYINNMHTNNIFLNYLLAFPITYEKEIRNKMLKSFEKGIKKSLPLSILEDKELMENFSISNGTNEPTAYFLCAVKEYKLSPKEGKELYYGVFDFGGGTTDFSFGVYKKSLSRRYDNELTHFGESGDKYLGGENILRTLAYETFKENKDVLKENNISIYCPEGCEKVQGYEDFIVLSSESKYNIKQLCEKLRNFWENSKNSKEEYQSEKIKISLLDKNRERVDSLEIEIDVDKLNEKIYFLINRGVENFFKALMNIYKSHNLFEKDNVINIFLSGNSSKNPLVKKIFEEKINNFSKKIGEKCFKLYPPLGTEEAFKIQNKKHKINNNCPNGKTGTAYGLLSSKRGGRIKIKAYDENLNDFGINFKYYVGYSLNGFLKVILDYKVGEKWVEFMEASEEKTDFYYSSSPISIEKSLSTEDQIVKRKTLKIDKINEEAFIFIRIKNSETIEYVTSYKYSVEEGEYLEKIKEIKLN